MIYESGYVEASRDQYASHHLASDMEFAKATTRKVVKHTERVDGAIATVLEETETSGAFQGTPVHSVGVETSVLHKKRWLGDRPRALVIPQSQVGGSFSLPHRV